MRTDAEKNGAKWAEKPDNRIMQVGNFIRLTRLDEFLQILNVLNGSMSFVGPRPERPEFIDNLADKTPYYYERHIVKPSVTGWEQLLTLMVHRLMIHTKNSYSTCIMSKITIYCWMC
jgi:lipopolysaccharide/colanic/teichoic acid biosynthesis glycosyltransferase